MINWMIEEVTKREMSKAGRGRCSTGRLKFFPKVRLSRLDGR